MVNGDELELRVKTKVLSGGALAQFEIGAYKHVQTSPVKESDPIASDIQADFTLKQVAGTGRAFPWKVLSL